MRDEEGHELDRGDTEVREEGRDDRAPRFRLGDVGRRRLGRHFGRRRLVLFVGHYSMIPPRVIASTSSTRSSCASDMSLRLRTIWRTDFPVRFASLMIPAVVS